MSDKSKVIPANKKPKSGWHWPSYWQVQADKAKDVSSDPNKLDRAIVLSTDGTMRAATDAEQAEYDNYRANNTHHYTDMADFAIFKYYKALVARADN